MTTTSVPASVPAVPLVQAFFVEYLLNQKNASPRTVAAYRVMPHTFCHDRALRFGNGFALGQTSLGYDGRFFLRGYSLAWAM